MQGTRLRLRLNKASTGLQIHNSLYTYQTPTMTVTVSRSTTDATLVVPEHVANNETSNVQLQLASNKRHEISGFQLAMQRAVSQARAAGIFMQKNVSLPSWLAIISSMVMGVLGLRYAYLSQVLAFQSMELAKWTAMKDFQESCSAAKVHQAALLESSNSLTVHSRLRAKL